MRTRKTRYQDYGITKQEKDYIMQYCYEAKGEKAEMIKAALATTKPKMDPYIAKIIFDALASGLSYERMCGKEYIYIGKEDFYGHRRQGIAAVKRWMILYGIWEL